ncbi:SMC family ATPase [Kovacikia minuta CCNUW1]|uniref:AAA family ATPase n=1 Tax=Kovacikia minuta TaxID=2931930 RepID=UPI001CCDB414|nr:SMC family ATPase [Kovacikia minuta]UBF25962.1 SMC family ATPase [Kovacikia minuta CCNUW1]
MEILSVTLKNFKSHSDRHFTFQPGTNAICGENGAGKTSILEAIAWTLFNYRGAYKSEDLIRNGAASAQVSVAFVSNRDQRTYEVSRCTRSGYTIFDPQLGEKLDYSRIEEEVLPWLRQQLGVAAGTDLADLFANTIGVPQGMFTADFLKTDRERKRTFDTILKVDEYRRLHDELLPLFKYAEVAVKELETEIAGYDADLQELDPLSQKCQEQHQEIEQVRDELHQLQSQLATLQKEQRELGTQAEQMQQLETQLTHLEERIRDQRVTRDRLQSDVQQAEQAAAICIANREAFQTFSQAEQILQELQQKWQAEQRLQQERRKLDKQLGDRQTQLANLTHQLEELKAAKTEIERLQPLAVQQVQLEQNQQASSQQLQTCVTLRERIKVQEKQRAQHQANLTQLEREMTRIRFLEAAVLQIPELERQQQRCQQQLSRIEAATQFEADLRQILVRSQEQGDRYLTQAQQAKATLKELQQTVPLWSDALGTALTALQNGTDWQDQIITALKSILKDLSEQTSHLKLERQLETIRTELQTARQRQLEFATLPSLLDRKEELGVEIGALQISLNELRTQVATEPTLKQQQMQLATDLEALNDPRGQIRLLTQKLQQQSRLETQVQTMQVALAEMQQAIADLDTQLAGFASLSEDMQTQQALKEQHLEAYQEYLAYRELANTRKERQAQLQGTIGQLQALEQEAAGIAENRDRLSQTFDPLHFQTIQTAYQEASTRQIALSARLPDMLKYQEELDQQLVRLKILQEKRIQAEGTLKQKRKVQQFVKFARDVYKKAGPRITERYIQRISWEADRLFRDLLNRANVGLEWTRDYEIIIQEGAHSHRFINLSGGEQMCAALAVRLALLKVLADIDIAFFDEPTTNMDRPRRESLAEAIANIRNFRQLFVISHDDTFEKVTENIILVEREAS